MFMGVIQAAPMAYCAIESAERGEKVTKQISDQDNSLLKQVQDEGGDMKEDEIIIIIRGGKVVKFEQR